MNVLRAGCVVVGATTAGLLVPGDIVHITAIMAVSLAVANGLQVWIAYRAQGIPLSSVLSASVAPLVTAPAALLVTLAAGASISVGSAAQLAFNLVAFCAIWLGLSAVLSPRQLRTALTSLRSASPADDAPSVPPGPPPLGPGQTERLPDSQPLAAYLLLVDQPALGDVCCRGAGTKSHSG